MDIRNLASSAATQFLNNMSMGGMSTSGVGSLQSAPAVQQLQQLTGGFAAGGFAAFGAFGFGAGGSVSNGFLSPPAQTPPNIFSQMTQQLGQMGNMWNTMGNMLSGGAFAAGGAFGQFASGGMMGGLQNMLSGLTAISGMLNTLRPMLEMANQLKSLAGMASGGAAMGGAAAFAQTPQIAMPNPASLPGAQPGANLNFPGKAGSKFLESLPNNQQGIARQLNVSGRSDEQHIAKAANLLKTAAPTLTPADGSKPAAKSLQLSASDVEKIRSAPNPAEAKKAVFEAISRQTGVSVKELNMSDKNGIKSPKAREALNKLGLGPINNGIEKNSGSSLVLDTMAEGIANSVRGGSFGSTKIQSPGQLVVGGFAGGGMTGGGFGQVGGSFGSEGGSWGGSFGGGVGAWGGAGVGVWHVPGQVTEIPNPTTGLNVNLSAYAGASKEVSQLASPLIFDLEGTGLQVKNGGMIEVDIDGDGKMETITDLDAELGLLVFDSKGDGLEDITGSDMFGDNTDLSKYGIIAPTEDGSFKDGFQALRALCQHYKLVKDGKQFLTAEDLAFLQKEVGLRMRVGGVVNGEDRTFSEVNVSQINLGNPAQTQHLEDAATDRWGNKIMYQDGATFTVQGEVRKYADIWFKIQARHSDTASKSGMKTLSKAQLMNLR